MDPPMLPCALAVPVFGTTGATAKQDLEETESSYFYEFL